MIRSIVRGGGGYLPNFCMPVCQRGLRNHTLSLAKFVKVELHEDCDDVAMREIKMKLSKYECPPPGSIDVTFVFETTGF